MRFLSSKPDPTYVIVAKARETHNGRTHVTKGLRAEFHGHLFDSEVAARRLRWTEEERVLVEQTLLENEDFGRPVNTVEGRMTRLYLADGPAATPEAPEPAALTPRCIFTISTSDGSEQCSRAAKAGLYCTQHSRLVAPVPA